MKKILVVCLILLQQYLFSQTSEINEESEAVFNMANIDLKPDFPGGMSAFYNFISTNFIVPKTKEKISGRIIVSFVVEKDGSLVDLKIIKDIGFSLGEEAIRVLKMSPKWIPGEVEGRKVRVMFALPLMVKQ